MGGRAEGGGERRSSGGGRAMRVQRLVAHARALCVAEFRWLPHGREQRNRKLSSHSPLDRVVVRHFKDTGPLVGVVAARVDERGRREKRDGKEGTRAHGDNGGQLHSRW